MPVRTSKFAPPVIPKGRATSPRSLTISSPHFQGMNTSVAPQNLGLGEAAFCTNFIIDDGALTQRSGLTHFSSETAPAATYGAFHHHYVSGFDVSGVEWHLVTSSDTAEALVTSGNDSAWTLINSNLSVVRGTNSEDYQNSWDIFYESGAQNNAVVFAHARTAPYYKVLDDTSVWTSFSDYESVESSAGVVTAFDERLMFFNTYNASSGTIANRVRWSVRGSPTNFTGEGAGLEDLLSMSGPINEVVKAEGYILIFSTNEIWRGVPRRDAYAFDFELVATTPGEIWHKTIQNTPAGVMWMGSDYNLYRMIDNQIREISPDNRDYIIEQKTDSDFWAQYNPEESTYMLFFDQDTQFDRAFFINVRDIRRDPRDPTKDKADWMLQDFPNSAIYAGGVTSNDLAGRRGYRNIFPTIATSSFNKWVIGKFDRDAPYDEPSNQAIPVNWISGAFRTSQDHRQFEAITEVTLDYEWPTAYDRSYAINVAPAEILNRNYPDSGVYEGYAQSLAISRTTFVEAPGDPGTSSLTASKVQEMGSKTVQIMPVAIRYPQLALYDSGKVATESGKVKFHGLHLTLKPYSGRYYADYG